MKFSDIMSKVRHFDNQCARWMMRHFYLLFFEFVLVIIFFLFLFNTFKTLDLSQHIVSDNMMEHLLVHQSMLTSIVIILLILNSFWMLYIFNGMVRIKIILKDINYNLLRSKHSNSH